MAGTSPWKPIRPSFGNGTGTNTKGRANKPNSLDSRSGLKFKAALFYWGMLLLSPVQGQLVENPIFESLYSLFLPCDGNQIDRKCPQSLGKKGVAPEGKVQGAKKDRAFCRGGTSGTRTGP